MSKPFHMQLHRVIVNVEGIGECVALRYRDEPAHRVRVIRTAGSPCNVRESARTRRANQRARKYGFRDAAHMAAYGEHIRLMLAFQQRAMGG